MSVAVSTKKILFLAPIRERYCLTHPNSEKQTYHLVLDLKGSGFEYHVGDCIGIMPHNDQDHVNQLLEALSTTGEETIIDKHDQSWTLQDFLHRSANLLRVTKQLTTKVCPGLDIDPTQYHLLSFIQALPKSTIDIQTLCEHIAPLTPRYYSIASSMKVVGNEAHLTVGLAKAPEHHPVPYGTCSNFLCHCAPLNEPILPIFLHRSTFGLVEASHTKPIIMIGPGTGIAPFRGFIQERIHAAPDSPNWLFFGEQHKAYDFYYEKYLTDLEAKGQLRLNTAFSRDQKEKVYVQHDMLAHQADLWDWIHHKGAYLYVCGDAKKMAKDVDAALIQIAQTQGKNSLESAKQYFKNLRKSGLYLRDIY